MPPTGNPAGMAISAGLAGAAGLAQTISGIINAAKTKKIAAQLERDRPEYQISQLAKDDLALAESEASIGGLSSRAETAYNNLNNQQFSSSLSAILKSGGSANNIGNVYGANQEGRQRLALLNDQMRLQKIGNLMKTREMYRGEQDKEFEFNKFMPWADKSQANAQARQQAQNNIWGGIGNIANAGMNYFGGKQQEKMYDKYFGGGQRGGQPQGFTPNASNWGSWWQPQQQQQNSGSFNTEGYNQIASSLNGEIF